MAPISFVYDVMFPYAKKKLQSYLEKNWDTAEMRSEVQQLQAEVSVCQSLAVQFAVTAIAAAHANCECRAVCFSLSMLLARLTNAGRLFAEFCSSLLRAAHESHVHVQAKLDSTLFGAKDVASSDMATAVSGIVKFVGELMRQDKKLTILKTLQVELIGTRKNSDIDSLL